jgi:5-(carboxyamino)imidazole ribonucleotide synthase
MNPIFPPATLGLMGGGQLGRMTALAARSAGYRIHALDPDPKCAIRPLVEGFIVAGWDDADAAAMLAKSSQVVTFEIEKVSVASLEAASRHAPVRPGPAVLELVQNRLRQKWWLSRAGFPVGPFLPVRNLEDLRHAARDFGSSFVKVAEGGYDGRGQILLDSPEQANSAWNYLGELECVAEKRIDLDYEVSVLVARRPSEETRIYPPAMNHHEDQILAWSVIPAPIPEPIAIQAQEIAREIAVALQLEGILVVEMFVTRQGQLLVNELAPRPHNSYHASERGCVTGQFEQLVRAVCNLPLGSAEVIRPAAIVNLLGELWTGPTPVDLVAAFHIPEVRLHLYDKAPRPGRKIGHISATGSSPLQALNSALRAKLALNGQEAPDAEQLFPNPVDAASPNFRSSAISPASQGPR